MIGANPGRQMENMDALYQPGRKASSLQEAGMIQVTTSLASSVKSRASEKLAEPDCAVRTRWQFLRFGTSRVQ